MWGLLVDFCEIPGAIKQKEYLHKLTEQSHTFSHNATIVCGGVNCNKYKRITHVKEAVGQDKQAFLGWS